MEEVIKLDEVDKYNKLFGLETRHPLVSVVDLSKATQWFKRTFRHTGSWKDKAFSGRGERGN